MISLSMIVKNEEKHLRDCLESVKGIVDEIILVDTGSTDNTIKIAQEFDAKIFHFKWINDFAAARNFSLEHSTGDWILYLDADERLTKESVSELKNLTTLGKRAGYYCQVRSIDELKDRPSIMSYVRLFPNNEKIRFEGAVHEQIENSLRQNKFEIKNSKIEIIHVGYNLNKDGLKLKAKRNLDILLNEYKKNKSSYYAFQLGQTYGILSEKDTAIKYFKAALEDSMLSREYKSTVHRYIAIDFAEKQEWTEALEQISQSIYNDDQQPLALLTAAKIHTKLGNRVEAENFCMEAFKVNSKLLKEIKISSQVIFLNERDFLNHVLGIAVQTENIQMFNFFYDKLKLSNIENKNEDFQNELELFEVLLNNKPVNGNKIDDFIKIINQSNLDLVLGLIDKNSSPETKILFFQKISEKFPNNSVILNKLGLSLASIKQFDKSEIILENSIKINPDDPSTIFYLISVYLQTNNMRKIINLIKFAEEKFSNMKVVIDKINLIKQRLNFSN